MGQQRCEQCEEGRYSAEPGQFTCKLCEAGKSLNKTTWDWKQGKACVDCPSGLYSRDGDAICKQTCDEGTQKDNSRSSSSCYVCPNGEGPWDSTGNGSWTCGRCPEGQFKDAGRCYLEYLERSARLKGMFCGMRGCQENTKTEPLPHDVALDGCGATECPHMNQETWAHFHFHNMDDKPDQDSYYNPRHCGCTVCGAGKYNDHRGVRACTNCPAGRSSGEIEQKDISVCRLCTPGYFAETSGMTECLACPIGKYSNEPDSFGGNVVCNVCMAGQYQDEEGTSECKICDQNKVIGLYATHEDDHDEKSDCVACPETMFTSDHIACQQCEGGQFLQTIAKRFCSSCPIGYFRGSKANKADECQNCPKGFWSAMEASTRCDECDRGRYWTSKSADGVFSGSCNDCEAGKYQDSRGRLVCIDCPRGTMGEITSATSLDSCKKLNFTVAADCLPNQMGSRYLDDTDVDKYKHQCALCPDGGVCDYDPDGVAITASGVRTKAGFWRVPVEFYDQDHEIQDSNRRLALAATPAVTETRMEFLPCKFPDDCPEELPRNDSGASALSRAESCRVGTNGPLCAECGSGWIRKGGTCKKCSSAEVPRNVAILFTLLIMLLACMYALRRWLRRTKQEYKNAFKDVVMVIKIFISFQQVNGAVPLLVDHYAWPSIYLRFLDEMDFVNIDFLALMGLDCVISVDYRYNVAVALAIPCLIVSVMFILYRWNRNHVRAPENFTVDDTVPWYNDLFDLIDADRTDALEPREFQHMHKEIKHRSLSIEDTVQAMKKLGAKYNASRGEIALSRAQFLLAVREETMQRSLPPCDVKLYVDNQMLTTSFMSATVQMLLLVHAPSSQKAFYYFSTQQLGDKLLLRRDLSIEYGSRNWLEFLPVVLILLLGFTLMLPIVLGTVLFRRRKDLHAPKTIRIIGFLYARFQKGAEGWDVHESFRRLILTGMLIYFPPTLRAGIAVIVCTFAISTLHHYRPHKNTLLFRVAQLSFFLTTVKYLITMLGAPGTSSDNLVSVDQLGIVLIVMDLSVMSGTVACIILMICVVTGRGVQNKEQDVKVGVKGASRNAKKSVQVVPRARSRIHQPPPTARTPESSKMEPDMQMPLTGDSYLPRPSTLPEHFHHNKKNKSKILEQIARNGKEGHVDL